jgi:hypothetical protein
MKVSLDFLLQKQKVDIEARLLEQQILLAQGQVANLIKEGLLIDAKKAQVTQEVLNLAAQKLQVEAQTTLVGQQKTNLLAESLNIPTQGEVLVAQKCKLQAEFDGTVANTIKSASENTLLLQKVATEKAQTISLGTDADSVLGKQKILYQAQASGFARDAEQKAAKIMVDSWNVRKTVDAATNPDLAGISDANISTVVAKLRLGIGS